MSSAKRKRSHETWPTRSQIFFIMTRPGADPPEHERWRAAPRVGHTAFHGHDGQWKIVPRQLDRKCLTAERSAPRFKTDRGAGSGSSRKIDAISAPNCRGIQFVRVISAKEPYPYHSCLEPCVWCFPASEQAFSIHRGAWMFLVVSCFHGWRQDHLQAYLQ